MTAETDRAVLIEQAIARGETGDEIVTALHVSPAFVVAVWARMETANAEPEFVGSGNNPNRQPPAPRLRPCGTYGAWRRHQRHDEPPCEPCTTAMRAYKRDRHQQRMSEPGERPSRAERAA